MDFPQTVKTADLDIHADEYRLYASAYQTLGDLYAGGAVLDTAVKQSSKYLIARPKEMSEVFTARKARFSYTNLVSNVLGWYGAALLKSPPEYVPLSASDEKALENLPTDLQKLLNRLSDDCNNAGKSIDQFCADIFGLIALYKKAFVLIDIPASSGVPLSLGDQKASGSLDPFLILFSPQNVINWRCDDYGNLTWVVIKVASSASEFLKAPALKNSWYLYTQTEVACYSAPVNSAVAHLVEGYPRPHATSDMGRVPIEVIEAPEDLWLGNRIYLLLLNHLNLDNSLDWGLFMANLPTLFIEDGTQSNYGDMNKPEVAVSEVSCIRIENGGSIGYIEPAGNSFATSADRLSNLEERIYKTAYLMDQARSKNATAAVQSGYSKELDKTPSQDALSGFGRIIREGMEGIYDVVLAIAGMGQYSINVRGLDFSDREDANQIGQAEIIRTWDIQSDNFRRLRDKKLVRLALANSISKEELAEIYAQIDSNPTPEAAQSVAEAQRQAQMGKNFADGISKASGRSALQ